MLRLIQYVRDYLKPFGCAILLKGLGAVTEIFIPLLMGMVIDNGIANNDQRQIIILCSVMLLLTAATLALNLTANNLSSRVTQGMGAELRKTLYGHIQNMKIQDVENITPATLITRATNDVERVQNTLLMMCRVVIRAPTLGIGGIILSLWIDWKLTMVIFGGMLFVGIISYFTYRLTFPIFRKVQVNIDRLTLVFREALSGIKVIKSFNKGEHETERFDSRSQDVCDNEMAAGKVHTVSGSTIGLINGLTVAGVLLAASFRIRDNSLAIGQVITVINYVNQILMAMTMIPRIFMMVSRGNISAGRINEVLAITERIGYGSREKADRGADVLSVDNVSFKYQDGDTDALHNISFSVKPGETVGVIGGTGAGKSTLLFLLLRLYEPQKGKILLKGHPISVYSGKYLHENITAALQQYNIFAMTLEENITLGAGGGDEEELNHAVVTAQLSDVVDQLEGRFSYEIAQTGGNLSGGQKQRLNVARTLYRNAELTILDDVSSALDYRTDLKLRSALRKIGNGRSFLLISQRVSGVRDADRILVLKDGRMEGFDSHEALLESCGAYREICQAQGALTDREGCETNAG